MWNNLNDLLGRTILHPQYFAKNGEYTSIEEVRKHAHGTFLDIGCGRQWYRPLLEPLFKKYLALDHPELRKLYPSKFPVELEGTAEKLPVGDKSVDVALMNLVIEHVPNPEEALKEVKRVLKKNGEFILFAVENYPVHGDKPYTYQHFTKKGLQEMFKRLDFKIKRVHSFGNFWHTNVTVRNVYAMDRVKRVMKKDRLLGSLLLCIFFPYMVLGNCIAFVMGRENTKDFALGHVFVVSAE